MHFISLTANSVSNYVTHSGYPGLHYSFRYTQNRLPGPFAFFAVSRMNGKCPPDFCVINFGAGAA